MYNVLCSCDREYEIETGHILMVRLEDHRKAIVSGESMKSGMTGGGHYLLFCLCFIGISEFLLNRQNNRYRETLNIKVIVYIKL